MDKVKAYLGTLPYKERLVFGFITLFDPRRQLREAVFTEKSGISCMGLDCGEKLALDYLVKGRYFASTGTRFNIMYCLSYFFCYAGLVKRNTKPSRMH